MQRIPGLTLFFSADLRRERSENPHLLSHLGVHFLDSDACRFVAPERGIWSIFPPLRVAERKYCWPANSLTIEDATGFLIGSAVSAAYDDAVHGNGAPSRPHLPPREFETDDHISFFNEELARAIGIPLSWSA